LKLNQEAQNHENYQKSTNLTGQKMAPIKPGHELSAISSHYPAYIRLRRRDNGGMVRDVLGNRNRRLLPFIIQSKEAHNESEFNRRRHRSAKLRR
jgi:hypothetical protein